MIGFKYSLSRSNVAMVAGNDLLTIIAAAGRALLVEEILLAGMAITSAANEVALSRSTLGTTGSVPVTATPLHPSAPAAAFTNFTAWATQPTLGSPLLRLGVNSNGGVVRWIAPPGGQIMVPGGGQLSLRPTVVSNTTAPNANITGHVILSEI